MAPFPYQHPCLCPAPPTGPGWRHEIKFDGYRMQVHVTGGQARWFTRNGHDWTDRLRSFDGEFRGWLDCVLDAELCVLGPDGQPSFSALRATMGQRSGQGLVLFPFDLLSLAGHDLRQVPLSERLERLATLLAAGVQSDRIRHVEPLPGEGKALLEAACALGLEGIVSKRLEAPYRGGRHETWLKSKCRPVEVLTIGGWAQRGLAFQGLLVGKGAPEGLQYVGAVRIGLPQATLDQLMPQLRQLEADASPFTGEQPSPGRGAAVRFVRPELQAEVAIAEWTPWGRLRQASFQRLA